MAEQSRKYESSDMKKGKTSKESRNKRTKTVGKKRSNFR
jgi:hypothetical protein